jgi:3-hydroxyisobutyrate dehydrogenase-like beta-hydroxyacid dehydrogenase
MSNEGTTVACIGLGRMGAGIARSIQRAGFTLRVYNRTAAKMQPFADQGATAAESPKDAATGADVVVTNLMDDASVLNTVTGGDGILAGLGPGRTHIDTTTISPRCARQLGPVVDAYTSLAINLGDDPGLASSMKLVVNYTLVATVELMGQVFAFGEKSGISRDMLNLAMGAFFGQPALQEYARLIHGRDFSDPGFTLSGAMKDMELMMQAAGDIRAPLPFGSIVRDKLLTAAARGMEDLDWAAISEISRIQAGLAWDAGGAAGCRRDMPDSLGGRRSPGHASGRDHRGS